ncbi:hypothetical protein L9F63_006904, partial [Diploptera punctata]
GLLCELEPSFGEFGVYDLVITDTGAGDVLCSLTTIKEPVNIYLPLLICILGLIFLWVVCSASSYFWSKLKNQCLDASSPGNTQPAPGSPDDKDIARPPQRQRLKSLDTFRGISIVLMIFVNDGAGGYWFLEHVTWNGLQVADLLFPWFMWIMGVCVPISIKSQLKKNVPRLKILTGVIRRACILFLLGLIINSLGGTTLETMRIFGVLQRFGVVYFVIATLSICFTSQTYGIPKGPVVAACQDIIVLIPQWLIIILIIGAHYAIVFHLEVPGCPMGYLGPGGIQDNGDFRRCVGGATGYVDRMILGVNHMYQNPTENEVYKSGAFEPEGIVGCLLSVFQVFLGVQAGTTLTFYQEWKDRLKHWLAWGTASGIIGAILCLASKEEGWIPVNKNLWSLSFVLVTSSFAFFLLSACYFLIDVKFWWSGKPFFYPGMNATIMFVGHEVAYNLFPWHWSVGAMNTHFMQLIEALWGTGLWILVAIWLYHIKFFLSL